MNVFFFMIFNQKYFSSLFIYQQTSVPQGNLKLLSSTRSLGIKHLTLLHVVLSYTVILQVVLIWAKQLSL